MSALDSKNRKVAKSFKDRLEQLECPYTEGVEESWILELVFHPGEPRIRLLQWLLTRFDPSLDEILDPKVVAPDSRMDSRIQRLLFVVSTLGLCKSDDVELIRGTCAQGKQTAFMDHLLNIVCVKDKAEDPRNKGNKSPMPGIGSSVEEQFRSDCWFLDNLVGRERIDNIFSSTVQLLPPDLERKLESHRTSKGLTEKDRILLPDTSRLEEQSMKLSQDLYKQQDILEELVKVYTSPDTDAGSRERITRTLSLALSEMSQLIVGFSYCFENEMRPWCNREAPRLTGLGAAASRVHKQLKNFVTLLDSLSRIRSSHSHLTTTAVQQAKTLADESKQLDELSQTTSRYLQDCIDVLEDSVLRHEHSVLKSPNATINASTLLPA